MNKIIKIGLIIGVIGIAIGGIAFLYVFNMPHRNVQAQQTDYTRTSSELVAEYLNNANAANAKYLSDDGNSKIIKVTGTVANISDDYNGQTVILIKETNDKAGVSATFTNESKAHTTSINVGDIISVKGVIRSGATYDEDLELYEHVVLDKSDIVK